MYVACVNQPVNPTAFSIWSDGPVSGPEYISVTLFYKRIMGRQKQYFFILRLMHRYSMEQELVQ